MFNLPIRQCLFSALVVPLFNPLILLSLFLMIFAASTSNEIPSCDILVPISTDNSCINFDKNRKCFCDVLTPHNSIQERVKIFKRDGISYENFLGNRC